MLARSRGAKLTLRDRGGIKRLSPEEVIDEEILFDALDDIAFEFKTTQSRYLDELGFWGKDILKHNPRKDPK